MNKYNLQEGVKDSRSNTFNYNKDEIDSCVSHIERLEARLLLNSLPVGWTHLTSDAGQVPAPEISDGQTAALVADINRDGLNDYVITSWQSTVPVAWYQNNGNGWDQFIVDTEQQNIEAGGTLYDIDNDGDLDLVFGGGYDNNEIHWWENPYPVYDPQTPWVRRTIMESLQNKFHDMGFADVDGDGVDEFVSFNQGTRQLLLFEIPEDPINAGQWDSTVIHTWPAGREEEGLAFEDINLDGKTDIIASGRWFEHIGDTTFIAHDIDVTTEYLRVTAGQLIEGSRPEVIMSAGDSDGQLKLYQWNGIDWTAKTLLDDVKHGHSLQIVDVNEDGFLDIVLGEMGQWSDVGEPVDNPDARVIVLYGDGQGNFDQQIVSTGQGVHEAKVIDLDGDGDLDILGKPFRHNIPSMHIWLNETNVLPLDQWRRHEIESDLPSRAVFVEHADIDGDGYDDVVAGGWWYRNPQSIDDVWQRFDIGDPMNNFAAIYDFDGDGDLDIFGLEGDTNENISGLMWAENDGSGNFTIHTNIDPGQAVPFLQGTLVDRFGPNRTGDLEVTTAWENSAGGTINYTVGDDPTIDTWLMRQISPVTLGEELDSADIDFDGDQDLLLGTKWLRNDVSKVDNWWNADWSYRAPVTIEAGPVDRFDKPIDIDINFTTLLANLGESAAFDLNSIRVIEVDSNGQPLDTDIAFQFDPAADYDAANNAAGNLVVFMQGHTIANSTRTYHVYFDVQGKAFTPAAIDPLVAVTDNIIDEGQSSFQIDTTSATYLYQKQAGGFSSIIDTDGNDWINHHPTGGSAGNYRGIPNLAYPEGYFHPGDTATTSTLINSGPVKATIHSMTNDGQWEAIWEIYPDYATMTVLQAPHDYWFLYEGTPGGQLDMNTDFVVRSDGTATFASQPWSGDITGEEWVYFADPGVGRSLFVAHHEDDNMIDSYSALDDIMTVFGFGRDGLDPLMSDTPAQFTIGLMDATIQEYSAPVIRDAYQDISTVIGTPSPASAVPTTDAWTAFTLFDTSEESDRAIWADINQDGLLDAIVTYSIHNPVGRLAWYEQPATSPTDPWIEHSVDYYDYAHSLDVVDIDGDGDLDIATGEHKLVNPATSRAMIYENLDGTGGQWQLHVVYTGDEQHDGMQMFDADLDGDLDIVSIGWINDKVVIYENLALSNYQTVAATPDITPESGGYLDFVTVSIVSTDENPIIYYTLDGSEPTEQSMLYTEPFTINTATTVKAKSFTADLEPSGTVQADYYIFYGSIARISDGLQVLYEFDQTTGDIVYDTSGIGSPLDLIINNPGRVTRADGSLTVNSSTIISSQTPATKIIDAVQQTNEITIEAWLTTSSLDQNGPARIVTLSADTLVRNFTLGQGVAGSSSNRFDVRLRTTDTGTNGNNPSLSSPTSSLDTDLTHIIYTRDASGNATIYINNEIVATDIITGDFSNWDANYQFALANELTQNRPWRGTFDLVAVYDKALTADEVTQNYYVSNTPPVSNQPPVANDDQASTDEDTLLSVLAPGLLLNDTDADSPQLTVSAFSPLSAAGAIINVNPDGSYSYDPRNSLVLQGLHQNDMYNDTFTYTIYDGQGGSDTATVMIDVLGQNDQPSALPNTYNTFNTTPVTGNLIDDDTGQGVDADLDSNEILTVNQVNNSAANVGTPIILPSGSTLLVQQNGDFNYDPATSIQFSDLADGQSAQDTFTYTIIDSQNQDATATVTITVFGPNTPPVAVDDFYIVNEDNVLNVSTSNGLLDNDMNNDNDPLTALLVNGPTHGLLSLNTNGSFIYTPNQDFFGQDSFTYLVNDTLYNSNTATVTITINPVNDAPTASDDGYNTLINQPIVINSPGVLQNDSDIDNPVITANLIASTVNGELQLNPDGSFTYTPDIDFTGVDSFTYIATDSLLPSNAATVTITVTDEILPLDQWQRHEIDSNLPYRTIFVHNGDIDGDNLPDIITGGWWYKNPGTPGGQWLQNTIGSPLNNIALIADFDGDTFLDILGTEGVGSTSNTDLVWAHNDGNGNFTIYDNIPAGPDISLFDTDQAFLQGAEFDRFGPNNTGPLEIVLQWNQLVGGTNLLTVPANPTVDPWSVTQISPVTQGEQVSVGDIDRDGDNDILLGTKWLRNEQGSWTDFTLNPTNGIPDRNRLADVNGDGRLDAVVAFGLHGGNPKLIWYEQPTISPTSTWIEHEVAIITNPQSLDVADIDRDGDLDLVVGEHNLDNTQNLRAIVYENMDGSGGNWSPYIIHTGDEHHDGMQLIDIDLDGDLDVSSIGWVNDKLIVYENLAIAPPPTIVSTPTITPNGGTFANSVDIILATDTNNADIYYTLNGSTPDEQSFLYSDPFTIVADTTVTARAFYTGLDPSPVISADFTITTTNPDTRVTDGLLALYEFSAGTGNTVYDISNVGTALDLTINDPAAVTWGDGDLTVNDPTIIATLGAADKLINAITASNEITVEAWVATSDLNQNGPARIVTLSSNTLNRDFTLGQGVYNSSGDRLEFRLRTTNTGNNGSNPSLSSPIGSLSTDLTHIVYTRNTSGQATMYIDDVVVSTATVSGSLSNWNNSYKLAFANELTGDRPWIGTLDLVAIYDRALSPDDVSQNFLAGTDGQQPANQPPQVNLGPDQQVTEGDIVAIAATFTDADSADTHTAIVNWGDGTIEPLVINQQNNTINANHQYTDDGQYSVTLTVTDSANNSDFDTLLVTVNNDPPAVNAGPDQQVDDGQPINVNATFTDAGADDTHTATVNFGDGTVVPGQINTSNNTVTASHTYASSGIYTVTVTVFDDDTGSDADTLTATVNAPNNTPPVVTAGPDQQINEGSTATVNATFTDEQVSDTHTATINWGDGTITPASVNQANNTVTASHQYLDDGTYLVTVSVTDSSSGLGDDSLGITVNNLAPTITPISSQQVYEGQLVTINTSFADLGVVDTHTATVNFGDGTVTAAVIDQNLDTLTANHTYADDGIYQVTVTLADDDNGSTIETFDIQVDNVAPTVNAGVDQQINYGSILNINATFTDQGSGDIHTATVNWGDGLVDAAVVDQLADTVIASHTYASAGFYNVTVTVTDDDDASSSDLLVVLVVVESNRVTADLVALYEFSTGNGDIVYDISGVGEALNLTIDDPAAVTWGNGTLTVNSATLIHSGGPADKLTEAITTSGEITIEAWVATSSLNQNGPARIVTLSTDPYARNFTLGQGVYNSTGNRIDVRLRTTSTGNNGSSPSVSTPVGSLTTDMTHIVYTRDASGQATIYFNGTIVVSRTISGDFSNWNTQYELALANELTGDRPWLGTFDLVAFYNRALDESEVIQNYQAGTDAQ